MNTVQLQGSERAKIVDNRQSHSGDSPLSYYRGDTALMNNSQWTETPTASLCPYCEGRCDSQIITLTLRRSPALFAVIRNVPAEVCQVCGEAQFTLPTALRLLTALKAEADPVEVALTPIYDFAVEV